MTTRPPRTPPRPKHSPDFTMKILYCRGCHNEIHPDMPRCLVCGTENPREPEGTPPRGVPAKKQP
jgi:hypothetical protein